MTDSDTESFHSAVGSLSDREEINISDTNVMSEEIDEGRKESSKCKPVPKGRNDCLSMDKAHFDSKMEKIIPIHEMEIDGVSSGKTLDSQILKWPTSKSNKIGIRKMSKPENNDKSDKISRKDKKIFEINTFKDGMQNCGIDNDKTFGSKDSEQELIMEITDDVENANIIEKIERSEEKTDIVHDGWDDWELQYPRKDENDVGILGKNRELPPMLVSDDENQITADSKLELRLKKEEVRTNKSFWNWAEFGDVVAAVGEGLSNISSAVESGLGLPTPEELVKNQWTESPANASEREEITNSSIKSYSKLFAGFGANIVTGSLDVLEALGKKTFEKLTVPEQGSEKRRFIFEPERGQNLSEVLRELRENRTDEVALETNCITNRELTFIDFFEKFSGILHLEGLEMLSKNYLRKIPPQRRGEVDEIFAEDLANTLEEYQENQQEYFLRDFKEILLAIALPYNGSDLMDSYRRCQERLEGLSDSNDQILALFLECLADFTAHTVQSIHKLGQLLLITATAVKQEPFSDFYSLIGRQISFFSNHFAQHISTIDTSSEEIEELVTAVFLAAGDSFSYIQQSFRLLRPLLIL